MKKVEENAFFNLFKPYGVADLCVQALTVKYDLDKGFYGSNSGYSDEEKAILYGEAIKAIKVAEEALKVDFDRLFDEIDNNLEEVHKDERRRNKYCQELLSNFGGVCTFMEVHLPVGRVKRTEKNIKQYEAYKKSLEEYSPLSEKDKLDKQTNIDFYEDSIELENHKKQCTIKLRNRFMQFCVQRGEGIVEDCYAKLFLLLQNYAQRLDWVLLTYRIDLFALQETYGIYIKDPQIDRSVYDYVRFAGSEEIAQGYMDALYESKRQAGAQVTLKGIEGKAHYHNDNREIATKQFANLVKGGYLSSDTLLSDWLYIYGADDTKPNEKPLRWRKTQSELGYLVQSIWGDTDPNRLWAICENVFTIKGEKPNIKSIKSKLSNIKGELEDKPKSYFKLNEVLKA